MTADSAATFAASRFGGMRATLRTMPTLVAVAYVLVVLTAVLLVAVALVAGLLGELAERLAVAGWAAAAAVCATHQPSPPPRSGHGSSAAPRAADTGSGGRGWAQ